MTGSAASMPSFMAVIASISSAVPLLGPQVFDAGLCEGSPFLELRRGGSHYLSSVGTEDSRHGGIGLGMLPTAQVADSVAALRNASICVGDNRRADASLIAETSNLANRVTFPAALRLPRARSYCDSEYRYSRVSS